MGSAALVCAGNACSALYLSFECMAPGMLGIKYEFRDHPSPVLPLLIATERTSPDAKRGPLVPHIFGVFRKYGGGVEHLAKIGKFCVWFVFCACVYTCKGPQACSQQPIFTVPGGVRRGRGPCLSANLA